MINEEIIVYQTNNDEVVFHTLHELQNWDPGLVMRVRADKLNFQERILVIVKKNKK